MNEPKKNRRPKLNPKSLTEGLSVIFATFFGSGLLPKAPGTWGTIASLPLFWFIAQFPTNDYLVFKILFLFLILCLGTVASIGVIKMSHCNDHQSIVIDEVLGVGITLLFCNQDWKFFLLGTFLFRFFDIVKWAPVNWIDDWSKKKSGNLFVGGFGVMADDLVAGVQALLLIEFLKRMFF